MTSYGLPLGRLYGPAWLNSQLWDPGFKCVWTAEKDQSGHHCPDQECEAEIKTRCYDKLHVAFCLCIVTMTNGQQRFCGHRFQAESPKACALHGWGEHDENRVFQRAKKGLSFELPELIPHEQPGWEMVLGGIGRIKHQVHVRMGLLDGESCFVQVQSWRSDGQPDQVTELARVATKEMLMTGAGPTVTSKAPVGAVGQGPEKEAVRALIETEQNDGTYNDLCSYEKYTALNMDVTAAGKLEKQRRQKARAVEQAGQHSTSRKRPKKCSRGDKTDYKRFMRGTKK